MAEATKPIAEDLVHFIYEPVKEEMDQVVDNLRSLARQARLSQGRLLEQAMGDGGGKKIRPVVTLLSGSFHPSERKVLVTMATAVELLHIATLIHDDTVDKADTRRGRATISSQWGGDVAVLLGDYVFATSATFVCDTGNIRVVRRFSETIMELAQGELAEHFSTHDWGQTTEDYNKRIYNKTASLFCTAAESGGVLSGAPEAESQALKDYGYNLGMAFQIMDDVLDFLGTEAELGKPVGNDLLQGTLTLPALLFAQRYPEEPIVRRLRDGGSDPCDLRSMVEMVRNSTAIDETITVMDDYRTRARSVLRGLDNTRQRQSLEALTDYVGRRRT